VLFELSADIYLQSVKRGQQNCEIKPLFSLCIFKFCNCVLCSKTFSKFKVLCRCTSDRL